MLATAEKRVQAEGGAKEHPQGSVQGICSGAVTLLALLIAFMGYTSLKNPAPWTPYDLWIQIVPAIIAAVCLVLVPLLATQPGDKKAQLRSMQWARFAFLIGAVFVSAAMISALVQDFRSNHEPIWPFA